MDVVERYRRASAAFGAGVHRVESDAWNLPTPCASWSVHDLVNHVVGENVWAVELFAGRTVAEVGSRFDGDLIGDDAAATWDDSAAAALECVERPGAMDSTVHLSFGDFSGAAYAEQLVADLLVHAWDLARATGGDETLDGDLVAATAAWFADWEDGYRGAGAIGPRRSADDADATASLLASFGRDPSPDDPLAVIRRFNEAFGRHDVDAVMALMTDDCLFEDTTPPHGRRHVGQDAVRAAWESLFASSPDARFDTEEGVVAGDRATFRWCYRFDGGSVRGVDVFRVRDGKVSEKLSYVKG